MSDNMAAIQEPEVQFAQRLASNEKSVRNKALKKLRKYIRVRSLKDSGGFTSDDLLKLWKGLFYCLWMQDKPLLQEDLSTHISTLIHSFHDVDKQLLFLESFLQTFKREWNGIDRLRMDKFFQLVRFMFRQSFEALKRKKWESSVVAKFLELLTAQLLQSSSGAPTGLQFHIFDLYLTELATVGSTELTADQNLIFIEPFCKTAAKTKNRTLFSAICSSIFSTIIDQAPFAIEDLMREVKAAEASDSDSGQASEEDDKDQGKEKPQSKGAGKHINGNKSNKEEEDEDDEDELLHLKDSETEPPYDDDIGPVLQFDYAALADRLFQLASRSTTPGSNIQRLYKIIKVLRGLSEGIFPQSEFPEEVSTDEDDDMFCSRKRMKRRGHLEGSEEGAPAAKKSKGKKKETLDKQNHNGEPADIAANDENRKKKKKKKKKKTKKAGGNIEKPERGQIVAEAQSMIKEAEGGLGSSQDFEKEAPAQSSISSVNVTEADSPEGLSGTLILSEVKTQPFVTVTESNQQELSTTDCKDQLKKKKKRGSFELEHEEQQTPATAETEMSSEEVLSVSGKNMKNKKGLKEELATKISPEICENPAEEAAALPETCMTTPAKKKKTKKKVLKAEADTEVLSGICEASAKGTTAISPKIDTAPTNKKGLEAEVEKGKTEADAEVSSGICEASREETTTALSETDVPPPVAAKKKSLKAEAETEVSPIICETNETTAPSPETDTAPAKKNGLKAEVETDRAEVDAEVSSGICEAAALPETDATIPAAAEKKKGLKAEGKLEGELPVNDVSSETHDTSMLCRGGPATDDATTALEKLTETATPAKKKGKKSLKADKEQKVEADAQEVPEAPQDATTMPPRKTSKKKGKQKVDMDQTLEELESVAGESTTAKKKKTQLNNETQTQDTDGVDEPEVVSTSGKAAKKKKRKIPVVFEFEADELEVAAALGSTAQDQSSPKKTKMTDAANPSTPLSSKKSKKMKATQGSASDFITFQSTATVPTPLFCKTKGSPGTPQSKKKKSQAPKSESKKVTFGLKNNKTAEFRKTDRSLLLSPDGSSRVPFDPQQKPKCGVLKSPPTPLSTSRKKTPNSKMKGGSNTPKSTPKQRPSAADFF